MLHHICTESFFVAIDVLGVIGLIWDFVDDRFTVMSAERVDQLNGVFRKTYIDFFDVIAPTSHLNKVPTESTNPAKNISSPYTYELTAYSLFYNKFFTSLQDQNPTDKTYSDYVINEAKFLLHLNVNSAGSLLNNLSEEIVVADGERVTIDHDEMIDDICVRYDASEKLTDIIDIGHGDVMNMVQHKIHNMLILNGLLSAILIFISMVVKSQINGDFFFVILIVTTLLVVYVCSLIFKLNDLEYYITAPQVSHLKENINPGTDYHLQSGFNQGFGFSNNT